LRARISLSVARNRLCGNAEKPIARGAGYGIPFITPGEEVAMHLQTKTVSALDETSIRGLTVIDAAETCLASDGDRFLGAVSNALVGNSIETPVFRVEAYVELQSFVQCLAAVAGRAKVEINGVECGAWRALPVPAGGEVRVLARDEAVYLAFSGLSGRMGLVRPGERFYVNPVDDFGVELAARYVPPSLLNEYFSGGAQDALLERILRHIRLACEMARRGAKLVRVKVGGKVFDVWVEEVG